MYKRLWYVVSKFPGLQYLLLLLLVDTREVKRAGNNYIHAIQGDLDAAFEEQRLAALANTPGLNKTLTSLYRTPTPTEHQSQPGSPLIKLSIIKMRLNLLKASSAWISCKHRPALECFLKWNEHYLAHLLTLWRCYQGRNFRPTAA